MCSSDLIDDIYDYVCALAMYQMPDIEDLTYSELIKKMCSGGGIKKRNSRRAA